MVGFHSLDQPASFRLAVLLEHGTCPIIPRDPPRTDQPLSLMLPVCPRCGRGLWL